jgi:biopolymer transport protein ExbD
MHRKRTKIDMYDCKIDLTPMIDLVFLLVMFFVLTSTFVSLNLEDVFLSVSVHAEDRKPQNDPSNRERSVVINIVRPPKDHNSRKGKIIYGGLEHTWETLEKALRIEVKFDESLRGLDPDSKPEKKLSKLEALVRADEGIKGEALRQVFEVCAKVGIYKVKLAAMQKK